VLAGRVEVQVGNGHVDVLGRGAGRVQAADVGAWPSTGCRDTPSLRSGQAVHAGSQAPACALSQAISTRRELRRTVADGDREAVAAEVAKDLNLPEGRVLWPGPRFRSILDGGALPVSIKSCWFLRAGAVKVSRSEGGCEPAQLRWRRRACPASRSVRPGCWCTCSLHTSNQVYGC